MLASDFDGAVAVFLRSNLARRNGVWPHEASSVARFRNALRRPGAQLTLAEDGSSLVGIALAEPLRDVEGDGGVIPDGQFLGYLYVVPERWSEGIGGRLLDAVIDDARGRSRRQIRLWTHEDNERSHRLYRSRGFNPTGRLADAEGEWALEIADVRSPPTGADDAIGGHS